jgi:hypothetical protein
MAALEMYGGRDIGDGQVFRCVLVDEFERTLQRVRSAGGFGVVVFATLIVGGELLC